MLDQWEENPTFPDFKRKGIKFGKKRQKREGPAVFNRKADNYSIAQKSVLQQEV
jgi:hypothetical protein